MASSPKGSKSRSSNKTSPLTDEEEKSKDKDGPKGSPVKTPKKQGGATPKAKKGSEANPKTPKKDVADGKTSKNEDSVPEGKGKGGAAAMKDGKRPSTEETDKGKKKQKVSTPTRQMPARSSKSPKAGTSKPGGKNKDQNPVALLDMLAEVAAATLTTDPGSPKNSKKKKIMGKLAEAKLKLQQAAADRPSLKSETLNLDQLRMLSDKLLLSMFAELTADEIRRNYTYTCFLMPDKCRQKFHSFGNETKARLQIKTHLLGHIAELLAETNATTGSPRKGKFTAEPVMARKRRLATEEENASQAKKTKVAARKPPAKPDKEKPAAARPKAKTGKKADGDSGSEGEFTKLRTPEPSDTKEKDATEESDAGSNTEADEPKKAPAVKKSITKVEPQEEVVVETVTNEEEEEDDDEDDDGDVQEECVVTHEQPFHDHCYCAVGSTKSAKEFFDEYADEFEGEDEAYDEDGEEGKIDCGPSSRVQTVYIGEATSEATYEIGQTSDGGEDAGEDGGETSAAAAMVQRDVQTETAIRQLEALRVFHVQKTRKQIVPQAKILEEEMARSLEDDSLDDDEAIKQGSPDWERRLALQCIRYLRTKKKDEHVPLVCRICKGKSFTAQATLMYHYRSHAGIKPFVCTICNTTFTRQHSLNYHMLIHNNKSRFTCGDCGRKFRHPSHFKEHMRRHTGETPFECSDCYVRFKTRNTYKRHLKTRHGKLLTANGIVPLTDEEFQKVKTNPKRRPRPRKDQETQWPEVPGAQEVDLPTISAIQSLVAMEENAEDGNMILPGELEAVQGEAVQGEDAAEVEEEEEEEEEDADDNGGDTADADTSMEPILAEFNNETQLIHISDDNKVTFLRADSSTVGSDGMKTIVLTPIEMKPDGSGTTAEQWLASNVDLCTMQAVSLSPFLKCT